MGSQTSHSCHLPLLWCTCLTAVGHRAQIPSASAPVPCAGPSCALVPPPFSPLRQCRGLFSFTFHTWRHKHHHLCPHIRNIHHCNVFFTLSCSPGTSQGWAAAPDIYQALGASGLRGSRHELEVWQLFALCPCCLEIREAECPTCYLVFPPVTE